jgi:predicted enzyme related to lactoylglutathione lyase
VSGSAEDRLVTRVDFVTIPTHDLHASAQFYGETLGLRRSVFLPDQHFAEFETDNLTLNLIDAEAMGLEHHPQRHGVALHVDDVAAARATLEQRGVHFDGPTIDTGVCHMAIFSDPEGNALTLHHRYAPRASDRDAPERPA